MCAIVADRTIDFEAFEGPPRGCGAINRNVGMALTCHRSGRGSFYAALSLPPTTSTPPSFLDLKVGFTL